MGRYIYKPLVEVEVAGDSKQQCTVSTVVEGEREEKEKKEGRSKQKEKPIASSSLESV